MIGIDLKFTALSGMSLLITGTFIYPGRLDSQFLDENSAWFDLLIYYYLFFMKIIVNAFLLIKLSCDFVTIQIIKVSDIKVKLWLNYVQAYRCNVVKTRNVVFRGDFDKRIH